MENLKDDDYYINKILIDLFFIKEHMKNVSIENFCVDELLLDSMMFRMIQIQENTKKLTDEYKNTHNNIPWIDITGFRNRIVHDYGNVDLHSVYNTLINDIPSLIEDLKVAYKK